MSLLQSLIVQLKNKDAQLFPGAPIPQIQTTSILLVKAGFQRIPRDYITFLQLSDGFAWNGIELFSCKTHERAGTVFSQPTLQEYQQRYLTGKFWTSYLVVGRAMECLICYNFKNKNYQLLDRYSLQPILKFPRFQDILYHLITTM